MTGTPTARVAHRPSASQRIFFYLGAAIAACFIAPVRAAIPDGPASDDEAARFLTMATFGPTSQDVAHLRSIGYRAWFAEQIALPPSLHRPAVEQLDGLPQTPNPGQANRLQVWFANSLMAPDQLRQRMAWALSQIFVVTFQQSKLNSDPVALAEYYDVLARDSLGWYEVGGSFKAASYGTLLYDVTRSPAMGKMLTYLRNEAGDDALGTQPDENYAREVMQLFSIGLTLRNADFSEQLDDNCQPIPTYTQATVSDYAKVFTGWSYVSGYRSNPTRARWSPADYQPLVCYPAYHDQSHRKTLLSYTGNYSNDSDATTLPDHNGCEADLRQGLNVIARHPNVAPFISRQLIQRFTTSNPTPEYVARVTTVFRDNGEGAYGDLAAVITAILFDPEARYGAPAPPAPYVFGKAREPLIKLTALYRAYHATSANGEYPLRSASLYLQVPLGAPSVFNYYLPDYLPPGELGEAGLFAPELQIINQNSAVTAANDLRLRTLAAPGGSGVKPDTPILDLHELVALAPNATALVDRLDHDLLYGSMSPPMRDTLTRMVQSMPPEPNKRVTAALHLVLISPEFAITK